MDRLSGGSKRGDKYAKRLLDRKRDSNQSYKAHSKTLQRRLSIMKAIGKNNIMLSTNLHNQSNPFEKEFSSARTSFLQDDIDHPLDVQYVSRWPNDDDDQYIDTVTDSNPMPHYRNNLVGEVTRNYFLDSTPLTRKYCKRSLSPKDLNFNNIECKKSDKFNRELMTGNQNMIERKSNIGDACAVKEWQEPTLQQRISLGEYFSGSSQRELDYQNYLNNTFDEEFEQGNAELQRQGPDLFFGSARVIEILEPELVECISVAPSMSSCRRSTQKLALVQENFKDFQPDLDVSMTTSLVSEDIRDLEREIDRLDIDSDNQQINEGKNGYDEEYDNVTSCRIMTETPKRIYPTLSKVDERISNNPEALEKLLQVERIKIDDETATDDFKTPYSESKESFSTPMQMPSAPIINLEFTPPKQEESSSSSTAMSFFKRNTSFFNNLRRPKKPKRTNKPNHESTRKNFSNNGTNNPISPISRLSSTISTLSVPNTPISPDTYMPNLVDSRQARMQQQVDMEATIPFEVENFLKMALGDDQHNMTSVTFTHPNDMRNRTYSNINASELISEERTPPTRNRKNNKNDASYSKLKHSKSLNRTLTIYRTLTQRIRNKFRNTVKNESEEQRDNIEAVPADLNPNLKNSVKKLLDMMDVYQTHIYQASKALDLCNSMREFSSSSERVELERLLVVANLNKQAARDEIRRVSSQPSNNNNHTYSEQGELTLSEISLQLREDVIRRERQGSDIVEWYIVVVTQGLTVWASDVVACPISGSRVHIPGKLALPGLTPDFRLTLSIYSMKLQPILMNHEDKYHITQSRIVDRHSTSCPSPQNFLRSNEKKTKLSPKQYEIRFSGVKESAFKLCGSVEFMLHDINLKSPWPLAGIPSSSTLHGTIDLKLTCRLNLSVKHSGFLTHGDEADRSWWNRRWCVLEGHSLHFWNYPREQESKSPLYSIDLVNCVSKHIELIDRTLCARPRTLLVEIFKKRCPKDQNEFRSSCTIIKNLLSCDTQQDLVEWQNNLNNVVSALREWNILETKSSLQISDL